MRNVDKLFSEELKMEIKDNKLIDYNYEDIKSIVLDVVRRWTKEEQHDLISTLIDEMRMEARKEFRKRFLNSE